MVERFRVLMCLFVRHTLYIDILDGRRRCVSYDAHAASSENVDTSRVVNLIKHLFTRQQPSVVFLTDHIRIVLRHDELCPQRTAL